VKRPDRTKIDKIRFIAKNLWAIATTTKCTPCINNGLWSLSAHKLYLRIKIVKSITRCCFLGVFFFFCQKSIKDGIFSLSPDDGTWKTASGTCKKWFSVKIDYVRCARSSRDITNTKTENKRTSRNEGNEWLEGNVSTLAACFHQFKAYCVSGTDTALPTRFRPLMQAKTLWVNWWFKQFDYSWGNQ
jgi:hypothetical protein